MKSTLGHDIASNDGHNHKNEVIAETDQLLERLISDYFDSIVEWILSAEAVDSTNLQRAREDLLEDFRNWFEQCLMERLKANPRFRDVSSSPLSRLVSQTNVSPRIAKRLPEVLDAVFLYTVDLTGTRNKEFEQLRPTLTLVVIAIQDLVLQLPRLQLPRITRLTSTARQLLIGILERVESLRRKHWSAEDYPDAPRNLRDASTEIQIEIARYNGQVWLPLLPLITAPLSKQDLDYYSRDEEIARAIAFHMVSGDGVMLVSGYRGVGKSSFVNLVIERFLRDAETVQMDRQPWKIIPIRMSLAKAESVAGVLRLCVRSMYDVLLSPDSPYAQMLKDDEMQRLAFAYARSTFKFGQQHKQSQRLSAEAQAELQVKLTEVLSRLSTVPLPSFKGTLKRAWSRQVEQTIGLLDYDEDRAEEDIARMITLLSRPRPIEKITKKTRLEWLRGAMHRFKSPKQSLSSATSSMRIKLVFVFDELDKMDEEAGQIPLVKQLKNLFLARNTVFVLITSKKFHYRLLEERRLEDAMLSSYFSWMTMVPLFGSRDTERLIGKSIAVAPFQSREREFVTALAQCLTYRSMGVPRDIVRELRNMQQWAPNSLQAFLSDRTDQLGLIWGYAEIQKVLEDFDNPGTGATTRPQTEARDQEDDENSAVAMIAPERLWLNDTRREQIRHGLYVLMEELLDRGFLEWDIATLSTKDSVIRRLYDNNFDLSTQLDFLALLDQLAYRLPQIRLDLSGVLEQLRPVFGDARSLQLFTLSQSKFDQESKNQADTLAEGLTVVINRIVVSPSFYQLTGRRVISETWIASHLSPTEGDIIPEDRIIRMLQGEDGQFATRLALAQLGRKTAKSYSPKIEASLYRLFIDGQDPQVRLNALQLLTPEGFIREAELMTPVPRLQEESDELILRRVIGLVRQILPDFRNRQTATKILLTLISVVPREWSSSTVQGQIEDPLEDVLSALATVSMDDILETVVRQIKPDSHFSRSAGNALMVLQDRSDYNLLDLLLKHGFDTIPGDLLERVIKREPDKAGLWTRLISKKSQGLARKALAMILERYIVEDWISLASPILHWLDSANWGYWDQMILRQSSLDSNPRALDLLQHEVISSDFARARERLPSKALQQGMSDVGRTEGPKAMEYRSNVPAAVVSGLLMLILFFWIPVDVIHNATMTSQLIARFLELAYLLLGFACLVSFVIFLISVLAGEPSLWLVVLSVVLGALAVGVFLVLTRVMGYSVTIWGQSALALIIIMTFVLPYAVLRITRKPVSG